MSNAFVQRWLIGLLAGTALAWVSSRLFVRSYSPRVYDAERGRWVRPAGTRFRWPLEGYGVTEYGATGLPGWQPPKPGIDADAHRFIALYGDSQAEGLCVPDQQKFHRQLTCALKQTVVVPLAESGDSCRDWSEQFAWAERRWRVKLHVILLTEMDDVKNIASPPNALGTQRPSEFRARLLPWLPNMLIHALSGIALDANSGETKTLRFRPGPIIAPAPHQDVIGPQYPSDLPNSRLAYGEIAEQWQDRATAPIVLVYAPRVPANTGREIIWDDPQQDPFELFATQARLNGIVVVDARPAFRESSKSGQFPHGFHNGQPGNGHLNAIGYALLANLLSGPVRSTLSRSD
ncbi:MAG: hypothetical protein AAGD07_12025 [Planctomycetota bacterium]